MHWYSGLCVSFHTYSMSYYEAQEDCKQHEGSLVKIQTDEQMAGLLNQTTGTGEDWWIGLTRWTWTWITGA